MKRVIAGAVIAGIYVEKNADVNGDGINSVKDIALLKRILAGSSF